SLRRSRIGSCSSTGTSPAAPAAPRLAIASSSPRRQLSASTFARSLSTRTRASGSATRTTTRGPSGEGVARAPRGSTVFRAIRPSGSSRATLYLRPQGDAMSSKTANIIRDLAWTPADIAAEGRYNDGANKADYFGQLEEEYPTREAAIAAIYAAY